MKTQDETIPWSVNLKHLHSIKQMIDETETYDKFQKFVLNITAPILEQISWNVSADDGNLDR